MSPKRFTTPIVSTNVSAGDAGTSQPRDLAMWFLLARASTGSLDGGTFDVCIGSGYRKPISGGREAMKHQELLSGLIRLHVLHHAVEGEIYGQWMIEELRRH